MSELYKKGDVIGGKFEVHRILGKGGFGVVYLAYDRQIREQCALKSFRDEFLADGKAREAFKKEALLWVNMGEHPFILSARWVEEFSGRLFVKMDYVAPDDRGRMSLADHLAKAEGPLNSDQALEWAIQFCFGMDHAVSNGIKCHRDIKPANIMITQDGTLKITDFGLAAAAGAAWCRAPGQGGSVVTGNAEHGFGLSLLKTDGRGWCGTPGYIPPEVYRHGSADIRSDIYSFGLVLWQMAAGSSLPPFVVSYGGDMEGFLRGVYRQQLTGRVPPVEEPLCQIIERCVRPDPSERYQDFGELRNDLTVVFRKRTGRTPQVPEVGERSPVFYCNKGASLHALGRAQEALGCYEKALAIAPRDADAWSGKGTALYTLGRNEEAIGCFDKAVVIDPRHTDSWVNKGSALHALGRDFDAIRCYETALAIVPESIGIWINKGAALDGLGRHEEAIVCYDRVLAIDPRDADAWYNKGIALATLGRREEALGCYDKALAIDPRHAKAWGSKGIALRAVGRAKEAIECYDRALSIDPGNANTWNNKGYALGALTQHRAEIACYDKALAINPRYATAWHNKGIALRMLGRHEEAIDCCEKALAIDPRLQELRVNPAGPRVCSENKTPPVFLESAFKGKKFALIYDKMQYPVWIVGSGRSLQIETDKHIVALYYLLASAKESGWPGMADHASLSKNRDKAVFWIIKEGATISAEEARCFSRLMREKRADELLSDTAPFLGKMLEICDNGPIRFTYEQP